MANIIPFISEHEQEMRALFEDLHQHPEIGFEETRTAAIVAKKLQEFAFDEVHTNVGKTGVVGILHGKMNDNRTIGLRADMDALPIEEQSELAYSSKVANKMHACGHDGHTTMLLGAAQYLAQSRDFKGTAVFIFQPAEEGLGGAKAMLADNLFQRFPCDEIYGMHNKPQAKLGTAAIRKGNAMAGASFFDIVIHGKGSHGAQPQDSKDALFIGSALVQQLQSIVSRNIVATSTAVLSCTKFHTGSAYNIIPETAEIGGTLRFFDLEIRDLMQRRMTAICQGLALAHDIKITIEFKEIFDVLFNDADCTDAYIAATAEILGMENINIDAPPMMGSEDFSFMLRQVPGAYININHPGPQAVHNPGFIFDPDLLPIGASIYARLIEMRLADTSHA
ncbi:M20 aminoacylase family protein [Bartonella sp. HY038]|uniref:M20 aminoacylase family protein n=1 Tax=Bartonella sp. HY038 TaxID=2759660 RepID=UPI0015FD8D6B|nr:M20 aminoacylase family protein [Bartonella sp. HY038]